MCLPVSLSDFLMQWRPSLQANRLLFPVYVLCGMRSPAPLQPEMRESDARDANTFAYLNPEMSGMDVPHVMAIAEQVHRACVEIPVGTTTPRSCLSILPVDHSHIR